MIRWPLWWIFLVVAVIVPGKYCARWESVCDSRGLRFSQGVDGMIRWLRRLFRDRSMDDIAFCGPDCLLNGLLD